MHAFCFGPTPPPCLQTKNMNLGLVSAAAVIFASTLVKAEGGSSSCCEDLPYPYYYGPLACPPWTMESSSSYYSSESGRPCLKRNRCSSSSSSSSSCSSSSSTCPSSYSVRPLDRSFCCDTASCLPCPYITEFTQKLEVPGCQDALITVNRHKASCKEADLTVWVDGRIAYSKDERNEHIAVNAGRHEVWMKGATTEMIAFEASSIKPYCPKGYRGFCYKFGKYYDVCFCNKQHKHPRHCRHC